MRIQFGNRIIECSDVFSQRDFTGASFVDIPDNVTVYGSCFSQETPGSAVFRLDMRGVTFRNCNLMNVDMPPGNTVIDCQTEQFKVQNDLNDWIVDDLGKPIAILNQKQFTKFGLPLPRAADIPATRAEEPVDLLAAAKAKI